MVTHYAVRTVTAVPISLRRFTVPKSRKIRTACGQKQWWNGSALIASDNVQVVTCKRCLYMIGGTK